MQPSMFNVRVPLADRGRGVPDEHLHRRAADRVAATWRTLLDRARAPAMRPARTSEERDAIATLAENGFIVESRDADRGNLERLLPRGPRAAATSCA